MTSTATLTESKSKKLAEMAAYVRCRRAGVLISLCEMDRSGATFTAMIAAAFKELGIKTPSKMGRR